MEETKKQDLGEKLVANGFSGPVQDRRCTDVLFGLLIVVLWACMTGVGIEGLANGDPALLIAPVDYEGNVCGYDSGVEGLPALYYVSTEGYGVCIDDCPSETDLTQGICLYEYSSITSTTSINKLVDDGVCMYQYASTNILNYCVFDDSDVWDEFESSDYGSYLTQFVADIYTAAAYIFGFGFAVAIVLGFLYIYAMRMPGLVTFMVWMCILGVLFLFIGIGYAFYATYEDWNNDDPATHEDYEVVAALVMAIVCWVCAFFWACLACWFRGRIELAIGIIKEASRAVSAMPVIIVWPLFQILGFTLFLTMWCVYAIYTASLGTYTTKTFTSGDLTINYKDWSYSDEVEYRGWFLIFCLFWTSAFIIAIGQIVVALAVSTWYFTRDKSTIGNGTVFSAARISMWYHLGTAAFGSLIVAIVQMMETVIAYFRKQADTAGNKVAEYILCCCQCCFWCLEKCIKFINKNAYIQTAIFSTPFCESAKRAFNLIMRNIARVSAVSVLSEFVLVIMSWSITLLCAGLSYLLMAETIEDNLNSLVGPVIMVAIIAYFTSRMFTSVYEMSIDTVLMCFIADEEMFAEEDRFAEHDLKEWVHDHGKHKDEDDDEGAGRARATPTPTVGSSSPPPGDKKQRVQAEVKP